MRSSSSSYSSVIQKSDHDSLSGSCIYYEEEMDKETLEIKEIAIQEESRTEEDEAPFIYEVSQERAQDAELVEKKFEEFKTQFATNAKLRLEGKGSHEKEPELSLTEKEKEELGNILKKLRTSSLTENSEIELYPSGQNYVFKWKKIENWVFKVPQNVKDAQNEDLAKQYVRTKKESDEICKKIGGERGVQLLRTPGCLYLNINGIFVVAEQFIPDLNGQMRFQKGLFYWGIENQEKYFKELFIQLTLYVCRQKFTDCKYNNIPLDVTGYCNLIDTDNLGAFSGLTRAESPSEAHGLLNYLPEKWLDEILEMVGKELPDEFAAIQKKVEPQHGSVEILKVVKTYLTTPKYKGELVPRLILNYKNILEKIAQAQDHAVKEVSTEELIAVIKKHAPQIAKKIKATSEEEILKTLKEELIDFSLNASEEAYYKILNELIQLKGLENLLTSCSLGPEAVLKIIEQNVTREHFYKLEKILKPIRTRIEKRAEKRENFKSFLDERGITKVTDPLFLENRDKLNSLNSTQKKIAGCLIEVVHETLLFVSNCDLQVGRNVLFDLNHVASKYEAKHGRKRNVATENMGPVLQAMKEAGIIFDYKFSRTSNLASIFC